MSLKSFFFKFEDIMGSMGIFHCKMTHFKLILQSRRLFNENWYGKLNVKFFNKAHYNLQWLIFFLVKISIGPFSLTYIWKLCPLYPDVFICLNKNRVHTMFIAIENDLVRDSSSSGEKKAFTASLFPSYNEPIPQPPKCPKMGKPVL